LVLRAPRLPIAAAPPISTSTAAAATTRSTSTASTRIIPPSCPGLFDINIFDGSGKDKVKVDFGGAGFTDDDPFELAATNRAFRLRVVGGSGDDTTKVNLANAATATFAFDVAILGGTEKNDITFVGTNPVGGTPTFGPGGSVLIVGGPGSDTNVDVFGNFPVDVVNAT
jgi:hypothetical protein